MASAEPDEIAACVLDTFKSLPGKFKPRTLADERSEWVPLAGIVLSRDHGSPRITCAALATGMKCLPQSKLSLAKGNILHDWHAEILALRAFNRFLIDECADLAKSGLQSESAWVKWKKQVDMNSEGTTEHGGALDGQGSRGSVSPPFILQPDVKIHMYCSEAPCGDASMELTMAEQGDATPWSASQSSETVTSTTTSDTLLGRGHFDRLGVVRRKPSRPDAPVTMSKSCSDKLALKQCTGLLSGPASLLIDPGSVYLDELILPESQCVPVAIERAFGKHGRMSDVTSEDIQHRWRRGSGDFRFHPFAVKTTTREFEFSRRSPTVLGKGTAKLVSSNLSAMHTPRRQEILINGVLQGRKQLDPRATSCVSRRMTWKSVLDIALLAGATGVAEVLRRKRTYAEMKECELLEARKAVKRVVKETALQGWVKNEGDESWELEDVG